jgi:hypothetical protein
MELTFSSYCYIKYYDSIILLIETLEAEKIMGLYIQVLDFSGATQSTAREIKMFLGLIFDSGTDGETATHA